MSAAADEPFPGASEFAVIARGHKFEDFTVGRTFVHHWGRTITEGDVVTFASATCHWLPLHLNREHARSMGHPDLVVPALLALSVVVGMSVEDLSEAGGPFLGLDSCAIERPIHVGDTLTAQSVVTSARLSKTFAGFGIVTWRTTASNQHGEVALSFERTNLVATRSTDLESTARAER
jgi:itaconyl-CoA hydratase